MTRLGRWVAAAATIVALTATLAGAAPAPNPAPQGGRVLVDAVTNVVTAPPVVNVPTRVEVDAPAPAPDPLAEAELADLPVANRSDATAVISALPVDPNPDGDVLDLRVRVVEPVAVYAEPGGTPVAALAPTTVLTATALPVFERDGGWALVPVFARSGLPSKGVAGQAVAWVWTGEGSTVDTYRDDRAILIDLSTGTLTVVNGDVELLTIPVGVGKPTTPTPVGRSAIAAVYDDPDVAYLGGRPVLALTRFSDAVDAFRPSGTPSGTQAPPLVAMHAYVTGSNTGQVSNGCLRLTDDDFDRLAELVGPGVPVIITG